MWLKKISTLSILLIICINGIVGQKASIHDKINADIYKEFSKAFETLDYDLFASIHSKEMIRISGNGGEIKNATTYLEGYQKRWSDPNRKTATIDFRLFERIYSDSLVSDRGIYKVVYTNDKNQLKTSYGQFHLLLKPEDENWKISLDYDSNENKTITKESFETAYPISEYKSYWKQ
ncbi:DUF4440 domain-containing protein [Aquimarina sp. AU474]|uniref:DUF4440 domain-containing protein n=1 Tax=Aquimarina sp. AU474 TaxID=2108529 RepID=UPI000D696F6F|nr:DUF4440 domain-containing protein [Aquimarina sp. AU474]